jgi:hypothetical protein
MPSIPKRRLSNLSFTQKLICAIIKEKGERGMTRLNIEFPADDYTYLKILCTGKGLSIKDFVVPLILKAMEEEEDVLLTRKAQQRLKNMNPADLIPMEEAFKEAGWDE